MRTTARCTLSDQKSEPSSRGSNTGLIVSPLPPVVLRAIELGAHVPSSTRLRAFLRGPYLSHNAHLKFVPAADRSPVVRRRALDEPSGSVGFSHRVFHYQGESPAEWPKYK